MDNTAVTGNAPTEGRRLGVLIVDDDESERELIGLGLQDLGFETFLVGTGFEAIKIYPRLRERLGGVILDMNMPGLDGHETLKRLRALDALVPIIILSGFIEQGQEDELLQHGASKVLRKPVTLTSLAAALTPPPKD